MQGTRMIGLLHILPSHVEVCGVSVHASVHVCMCVYSQCVCVCVCVRVCVGVHVSGVRYQGSSAFAQEWVGSLCMCARVTHVSEWLR